ncbi:uncharacterized protein LOC135814784 [Sycon ciliatum]|uniref:uncharacterized protein LOC135814784 n=1 Tax=Sycon ciliatum TaxID=27933 RepID=UPI0031F609A9
MAGDERRTTSHSQRYTMCRRSSGLASFTGAASVRQMALPVLAVVLLLLVLQQAPPAAASIQCHLKANILQVIAKPNCKKYHYNNSTICQGDCLNSVRAITTQPYYVNECRCCVPARTETIHVHILCSSGLVATPVARASSCVCKLCACDAQGAKGCDP